MTAIQTSKKLKLNSIKNKKPQLKSSKKETVIGKTVSKESKKIKNHTIEVSNGINIKVSKKKKHKKPTKDDIVDNNEEMESTTELNNVEKSTKHKKIKKKKQKNVTSSNGDYKEIFEENISEDTVEKPKKRKKRKLAESGIDGDNKEMSEEIISEETVEKPKKRKKRKLAESSIVDDDTDDEESPPKKRKKKVKKEDKQESEDPEIKARTVFVGNVPIKCTKKEVKKHFRKYGIIESLRIRGIPPANPKVSKKVAAIKQEFHPERNNFLCYIRYVNKEDALKAEAENGALFQGHHIRVHCCQSQAKPDESKAIFIGNLSFDATEDELWKIFEICGPISHVRIVRDTYSGVGKGFGYVNFKDSDAVQLALEMEDVKLRDRELRISLCNSSVARKNKKMNKQKEVTKPGQPRFRKPFQKDRKPFDGKSKDGQQGRGRKKNDSTPTGRKFFQGTKFTDKKKKFKKNKGDTEKKKKIDLIAPKAE